jgi:hypothetical protein
MEKIKATEASSIKVGVWLIQQGYIVGNSRGWTEPLKEEHALTIFRKNLGGDFRRKWWARLISDFLIPPRPIAIGLLTFKEVWELDVVGRDNLEVATSLAGVMQSKFTVDVQVKLVMEERAFQRTLLDVDT